MTNYYIKELKVNNFKSFGEPVSFVFGPSTNAIIDRNGADEFNVVEALGFVLCDRTSSANEEVICAQLVKANQTEGYVTVTIEADDYSTNYTFSRIISGNSCEFRINGESVNREEYVQRLKAMGMHAASKLLLLPRGEAEKIAEKTPEQLGEYLEKVGYDSCELKERYERAKKALDDAEEQLARAPLKRKLPEKDADAAGFACIRSAPYIELSVKYNNTNIQANLFRLYHYGRNLSLLEPILTREKAELKFHSTELAQLKEQKREEIKKIGEIKNTLREMQQTSNELQSKNKEVKNKIELETKKREQLLASLADCDVKKLEELTKDLKVAEEALKEFQRNLKEQEKELPQDGVEKAEYNGIKARAMRVSEMHLKALARRQQKKLSLEMELIHLNAYLQGDYVDERTAYVMRFEEQQQKRRDELRKEIETKKLQIEEINLKLEKAEETNKEMIEVTAAIDKKSLDLRMRQFFKKAADERVRIDNALKENFQTVYGRLRDVCQAKEAKYEFAVNAVLYDDLNVIIVDTEETKSKCVAYLKEKKLQAQIFWSLDTIPVPPVAAPLRHLALPDNVEYLVNKIKYEPEALQNAILHAVKNVLVCKTIEDIESRASLGLTPGKNVKVVTLDGKYYRGEGLRSLGKIDLKEQAKRLDEAAIKILEQDLENLKIHMKEIESKTLTESTMYWMKEDVEKLENEIKRNEAVLPSVQSLDPNLVNNAKIMEDVRKHRAAKAFTQRNLDIVNGEIERIENEMRALLPEGLWNDFCERFGYKQIQEFEEKLKKKKDEADARHKQEMALENTIEDLKSKIAREESEDLLAKRNRLAEDLRRCQENLDQLNSLQPNLKQNWIDVLRKLQDIQEQLTLRTKEMKKLNASIAEISIYEDKVHETKLKMKRIREERHFLLSNCKDKFIKLPIVNGDLKHVRIVENDYSFEDRIAFDFSSLPQNLKEMTLEERIKEEEDKFKVKLNKMQKLMDDVLEGGAKKFVLDEEEESNRSTKPLSDKVEILKSAFEEVKRERREKFLEAFSYVRSVIDSVYKELCNDEKVSVSFELVDADEPYFGEIRFDILSPTHGGELIHQVSCRVKIMAALALVFSIQHFQQAGFVVLDNADSLLGATNVLKLNRFLSKRRRQIIKITSKEESYVRTDILMIIGRKKENGECDVFTVDLSRYIRNAV